MNQYLSRGDRRIVYLYKYDAKELERIDKSEKPPVIRPGAVVMLG